MPPENALHAILEIAGSSKWRADGISRWRESGRRADDGKGKEIWRRGGSKRKQRTSVAGIEVGEGGAGPARQGVTQEDCR